MASNQQFHSRKRRNIISEINVTPLVDVLLVLLIIFMVAAPMITGKVDVNLPQGSKENSDKTETHSFSVSIKANGDLFLSDSPVSLANLSSRLLAATNKDFNSKILVLADKNLDYGKVMEVVRYISSAGFGQVVLVTEIKSND